MRWIDWAFIIDINILSLASICNSRAIRSLSQAHRSAWEAFLSALRGPGGDK